MSRTLSLIIFLVLVLAVAKAQAFDLSSSSIKIKNPPPIHLSHQAFDLLDIARLPLAPGVQQIGVIDDLVKRLGDYLAGAGHEVLGTSGIAAKPLAADGSIKYAYGNWMVKTAESTGIRLLEVRISELEEIILEKAPLAAAGLPFRFIIMPDTFYGQTFIHICLVDPLLFTSQFVNCDSSLQETLIRSRQLLCGYVRKAFPEAFYDPQLPLYDPPVVGLPVLNRVAQVDVGDNQYFTTLEDVVSAVQKGGVTLFSETPDEHPYTVNGTFADYTYLDDEKSSFSGVLSFPLFSMIKDGWKKIDGVKTFFPEWKLQNHSPAIEALIQQSFIHVYGSSSVDPQQRLKFTTAAGPIYSLQVFDAYTNPLLLHSGLWHYQALPTTILFHEATPGLVDIWIQDPAATTIRYYADVSDVLLASFKEAWDANPSNKTDWPAWGKVAMAEHSRDNLIRVIKNSVAPRVDQGVLLSPESLVRKLDDPDVRVIDARSVGYESGHILKAISLPHTEISDAGMNLKTVAELEELLTSKGIHQAQTIVIYDGGSKDLGAAARLFWMFEYLGCENVHLLDGGWQGWLDNELPSEIVTPEPSLNTSPFQANLRPEVVTTGMGLSRQREDNYIAIVDCRSDEEYNGWVLNGEALGGHIASALHLPYSWLFRDEHHLQDYGTLKDLFSSKGLVSDSPITVYSSAGIQSSMTYFALRLLGYQNIANYDGSYLEWSGFSYFDPVNFPIEKLQNYNRLVNPQWVQDELLINNNNGHPFLIVDTGWGPAGDAYLEAHIPGAIHVNTDEIEYDDFYARNDPPADIWFGRSTTAEEDFAKGLTGDDTLPKNYWNIYPYHYLLPAIANMGITTETTVVVYGADVTAAARVIWTLMYAGVEDVRLLNGGLKAWQQAGYDTESGLIPHSPVAWFGSDEPLHPEYLVDTEYIGEVVAGVHSDAVIADIRTWDEYIGATAPYSYIPTDGRIEGALWGHSGEGPWSMEEYVDFDGTLRSYTEVEEMWHQEGITADKNVSHYCGTGWRAALTFLYGYMMGWDRVNLYDGGWYEWSLGDNAADNPIIDDSPGLPIYD